LPETGIVDPEVGHQLAAEDGQHPRIAGQHGQEARACSH
jgi:hypothetical protein